MCWQAEGVPARASVGRGCDGCARCAGQVEAPAGIVSVFGQVCSSQSGPLSSIGRRRLIDAPKPSAVSKELQCLLCMTVLFEPVTTGAHRHTITLISCSALQSAATRSADSAWRGRWITRTSARSAEPRSRSTSLPSARSTHCLACYADPFTCIAADQRGHACGAAKVVSQGLRTAAGRTQSGA